VRTAPIPNVYPCARAAIALPRRGDIQVPCLPQGRASMRPTATGLQRSPLQEGCGGGALSPFFRAVARRKIARIGRLASHYPRTCALERRVGPHYRGFRGNVRDRAQRRLNAWEKAAPRRGLNQARIREIRLDEAWSRLELNDPSAVNGVAPARRSECLEVRVECGDDQLHGLATNFPNEFGQAVAVQFGRRIIQ
jgi:hypothetical protein